MAITSPRGVPMRAASARQTSIPSIVQTLFTRATKSERPSGTDARTSVRMSA
jgi:hypothetical protein